MIYIVIIGIIIYLFRIYVMYSGALKQRKLSDIPEINDMSDVPFVSVIIPAKDEENNIERAIRSVSEADYPKDKYEILAVDDRSDDRTGEILDKLAKEIPNLKVLHRKESDVEKNLKGKPGAIQFAADIAKGEFLLLTDADCKVHEKWIKTIVSAFLKYEVDLIPSFTHVESNTLFDKIQSIEWLYMHTMASAGVGHNKVLGAYGNNFNIRASVFHKIGGYRNIKFSVTEDLALMQAVDKLNSKILYLNNVNSSVTTYGCKTFVEYMNQKHRWAVGGKALGYKASIFVFTSFAIWLSLLIAIISGNIIWIFAVLFTRIYGDYLVINLSITSQRKGNLRSYTILSLLFFMLIELLIPWTLLKQNVIWKKQKF